MAKISLIALDSSLLANISRDKFSTIESKRKSAENLYRTLTENECIPLLCLHHLEELLKHKEEAVVENRITFLRELPLVAWIAPSDGRNGLGTIIDIQTAEVRVSFESPFLTPLEVRDLAAQDLILLGSGQQAIEPYQDIWRGLRPYLWEREARTREIVAISRSKLVDISNEKLIDFANGKICSQTEAQGRLESLRKSLEHEISVRGDKRITNAEAVANAFITEVQREGKLFRSDNPNPVIEYLLSIDIDASDINENTRMGEIMDLAEFRKKLKIVRQSLQISWPRLKSGVNRNQLPSWLIPTALRNYGQDHPERKGNDLNDNYLACLAAYANITYVDKRTKENLKRALHKCPSLSEFLRVVQKASCYEQVATDICNLDF